MRVQGHGFCFFCMMCLFVKLIFRLYRIRLRSCKNILGLSNWACHNLQWNVIYILMLSCVFIGHVLGRFWWLYVLQLAVIHHFKSICLFATLIFGILSILRGLLPYRLELRDWESYAMGILWLCNMKDGLFGNLIDGFSSSLVITLLPSAAGGFLITIHIIIWDQNTEINITVSLHS